MGLKFTYDVAVIGAGIGGYVAAIRSAQLGKKVALIEREKLGGTCLNWGCIPTKALLTTVDLLNNIKRSEEFGVHLENVTLDFEKVMARKDTVISRLIEGINFLIKKNGIHLIKGKGTILSPNQIRVQKIDGAEEIIDVEDIIVAAGSEEPRPSYAEIDEEKILTSKGTLSLKDVPESLAIVGGSIIGIEFAIVFKALGSSVKILEAEANLLPMLDNDIGRTYQRILRKKDIEVYVNTEVKSVKVKPNGKVEISAISKDTHMDMEVDKALVTGNRKPLSEELGLEKIGIQMRDGFIIVDEHMKTNVPNVYAVGDVADGKMFAHVAMAGGIVAAENIAGVKSRMDYKTVPTCVYCSPEAASVGLSEEEAKERGYNVAVGRFPLLANGKALTLGEEEGFAKVVCDGGTGEILGVHIISPNATELISEAALALRLECTWEEIATLVHPHPTISEILMESARAVSKKAIHV